MRRPTPSPAARRLAGLFVLLLSACGGQSDPPPPVVDISPNCDATLGNQVVASRQDELTFVGKETVGGWLIRT